MSDWLEFLTRYGPAIASGAVTTIVLTVIGAILGIGFGILTASVRRAWPKWTAWPVNAYIEIFRDTPFVVQLFFIYFGLPAFGIRLDAFGAAALTMMLNLGAYATEIVRAGFNSVPKGQEEAGSALGLHRFIIFSRILLPQAIGAVQPALVSQVVISMLDTAIVSQIALRDLTFEADLIQSASFRAFETYVLVTLLYLGLSLVLRRALDRGSRRFLVRTS